MSRRRSTAAVLAGLTGLLAASLAAAPASAAPTSSPQVVPIAATCPGLGEVSIVPPPGGGEWTPGFIAGTGKVLVPYVFTFTFSDGETTETETIAKRGALPAGSITCSFGETFVEDGVTYTFTGTATGPLRGKP
ncbi:hypothetical protein G7072_10180 [Nocardioides sp. HDW12B]|uniref:hypothetical protein n=1 Tax=Nocardioides sp. HDW12B TaxID=2714939 RepID=UPI00140CE5A3|nr:hypothetical protein [Nocardioides sp. HDW12B]QIK66657.1 hypothetical protein G7072_10180 [Nocardioides sp. HDW12B]